MKNTLQPPRLKADWPFPSYRFIPGKNPHPKKLGGHMEGQGDPVSSALDLTSPEQSSFLRYALDLYNYGYYWESHVYLEALWNAHKRVGSAADFFKALIKLSAAGVKAELKQKVSRDEHFERARELFLSVKANEGETFLGFDLTSLVTMAEEKSFAPILPTWR